MQRQKSILSFLQKPSALNPKSGGEECGGKPGSEFSVKPQTRNFSAGNRSTITSVIEFSTENEVVGIVTPPEKVPRHIFHSNSSSNVDDNSRSSLFSSIKHKFVKVDCAEKSSNRNQANRGSINNYAFTSEVAKVDGLHNEHLTCAHIQKKATHVSNGNSNQRDQVCPLIIHSDDDVLGPETPGMRPVIPRFKRVLEDSCCFEAKKDCSMLEASKRRKLQDSQYESKPNENVSQMNSKFEWLHPSCIRDSNRRKPGDPLFDKRTIYIPPDALKKMSASQKQYWDIKSQYMDIVLFFKVGKFYELYEFDAEIGHKELDWKMTFSGVGKCRQVGISESGIDDAVQKLIARGYKVGRIEQVETSAQAKSRGAASVIQRKLVHVHTPSTTIEGNIGPDAVHLLTIIESNCGLDNGSTAYGFAFVDCATLKLWVGSISDNASCAALGALLMQVSPKEIVYESQGLSKEAQKALKKYSLGGSTASQLTPAQPTIDFVDPLEVRNLIQLKGYFKSSCNLWSSALEKVVHCDLALCALGGLINHLSRLMLEDVLRNGDILAYDVYRGCLKMDGQTLINLEIFNNNADGSSSCTLFNYLDNCITLSGKRLLRSWICHPLKDVEEINHRLNVVEELMAHSEIMLVVAQYLRKLPDLERLLGRVKATSQSSVSLLLPLIGIKILKQRVKAFGSLVKGLRVGLDLLTLLQKEGQMISLSNVFSLPTLTGNDGLDKLLTQFEAAVDSDFPKYQDHDVKDSDAEILSILIELLVEKAAEWSRVIHAINVIDILRSFAVAASFSSGAMSKPIILPDSKSTNFCKERKGPIVKTKGLWHPFALGENGGLPVPNDVHLGEDVDGYHPRTLLLTGPNMGGKSTLLRATCLAVILAQLGCYVPCEMFVLSLVDIIFTRLGATDRIMTGESTFFVECADTASVLQNATRDSLVLLDELGRGTSTFDGYAIAYAVFRHLVEKINCRLLFATHYHPLTKEFASHPRVKLQHMACSFKSRTENSSPGDNVLVFLYRLASGACPESYGMQVALMAGIPKQLVEAASRAGRVMKNMIGESFRSSEQRSEFSTLHEDWLRTLLTFSLKKNPNFENDNDMFDTLFCLWHEIRSSNRIGQLKG